MREAQIAKVHQIAVLGKNEQAERNVSFRLHGEQQTTTVSFDEFIALIKGEIASKSHK